MMNLDTLEGFIEIEGKHPILITALHGFGADSYKDVVKMLKKCCKTLRYVKTFGIYEELGDILKYNSSVDLFTWEIAFKIAVAEELWAILPTLSKVDKLHLLQIPDYNLNKGYAIATPFWRRIRDLIDGGKIRILIDIHGMKNIRKWPDICISARGFTSASKELIEIIATVFRANGLRVAIDHPFIGGAFIAYFGKPPIIEALAIEIKRNLRFYGSKVPTTIRDVIKAIKYYIDGR